MYFPSTTTPALVARGNGSAFGFSLSASVMFHPEFKLRLGESRDPLSLARSLASPSFRASRPSRFRAQHSPTFLRPSSSSTPRKRGPYRRAALRCLASQPPPAAFVLSFRSDFVLSIPAR